MTQHRLFRIIILISFFSILISGSFYCYYIIKYPDLLIYRFSVKLVPTAVMMITVIVYFVIYKMHYYALSVEIGLIFCLGGDILLMLYIPSDPQYNNMSFVIAGGALFFLARVSMSLGLIIYPYRGTYPKIILEFHMMKTSIAIAISTLYTITTCSILAGEAGNNNVAAILSIPYFILAGIHMFLVLTRINSGNEWVLPQIINSIGVVMLNVSDSIVGYNILSKYILPYSDIIAICMYWLGLYLITISVVRSKSYEMEKYGDYVPLYDGMYDTV